MSIAAFQLSTDDNIAIVVGLGLVGSAIAKQLSTTQSTLQFAQNKSIDWNSSASLLLAIDNITEQTKPERVELIWAAGKAGFTASETQINQEITIYEQVLCKLRSTDNVQFTVSLISSAGGLYENSGLVENIQDITPSRAYAFGKLRQEKILSELKFKHRIYRVASVYGLGGSRSGLINTMLKSAKLRSPMLIHSNQNTLRDYVYSDDVACNVVKDVINNKNLGTQIIATGRTTSINMMLNFIKKITKRSVPTTYSLHTSNSNDIIFSRNLLSDIATPTSLEEGIRMLYKNMLLEQTS